MTRSFTLYALGCLAMAVTLACFIHWPALFLTVAALVAVGAVGAAVVAGFFLAVIYFVMGPGAAR
jgi:hypothetical protein